MLLPSLISVALVVAVWSLLAGWLDRRHLTAPLLLVSAGIVAGLSTQGQLVAAMNTDLTQRMAEIILAVLMFLNACDVNGGFFGRQSVGAARLLVVALPLSLGLSVLLGLWLLPGLPWAVLLALAIVVVPIEFAPAASILRDTRVPERVRTLLNVEGGYNDGIASPLFVFALVLAGDHTRADTPGEALALAVPQALGALVVGGAVGAVLGWLTGVCRTRGLMAAHSMRFTLVAAPLLSYWLSMAVGVNGFIAAFVCGITFRYLRRAEDLSVDLTLLDDVGFLLTAGMWFALGATAVLAAHLGVPLGVVVFAVAALTVVRILPVMIALAGSSLSWGERLLTGWLGPRGTTSIVFALLAFNALPSQYESQVLKVTVVTVVGSVLVHGIGAPLAARAYAARSNRIVDPIGRPGH